MKRIVIIVACLAIIAGSASANVNIDPKKKKETEIVVENYNR